jgi:hypothetical protein
VQIRQKALLTVVRFTGTSDLFSTSTLDSRAKLDMASTPGCASVGLAATHGYAEGAPNLLG